MKMFTYGVPAALLVFGVLLAGLRGAPANAAPPRGSGSGRPDIEYFEAINRVGPPQDPQILFLLMGQFSNANMQQEGAEFFAARLKEFEPRLSNAQKSLYLSAIALLRA